MIKLAFTQDNDLPSQLTTALRGRRINLFPQNDDQPHLYTGLRVGWRGIADAAVESLAELRKLQAAPNDAVFDPSRATRTLRNLIYAATELFDIYHQAVPQQLECGRGKSERQNIRSYQGCVKRLRDPIARMCNLMKHEFREIVTARFISEQTGAKTFVFRINVALNGLQQPDPEIHRKGAFLSIERILHEIIHGLLRVDHNAAELARNLSDNQNEPNNLEGITKLGLTAILADLSGYAPTVAESEPTRFDGVLVENQEVWIVHVVAKRVPEPTLRTMQLTVDGAALSAQLML